MQVAIISVCSSHYALAGQAELRQAIGQLIQNHPDLKAQRALIQSYDGLIDQATWGINPVLETEVGNFAGTKARRVLTERKSR